MQSLGQHLERWYCPVADARQLAAPAFSIERRRAGARLGIPGLVAALIAIPCPALAQTPDAGHAQSTWPYALPFWGEKLAERGIAFPLPFGIGLNYAFIDQPIEISRVAVGVNDSELVDMSDLITFDELNSRVHALNLRADVWVLPFLNVYAMGNWAIEADTQVSLVEPFALDAGATQSGYGGGFGFTVAGGVWGYFATLDLNWTWNKLEKLDVPVGTFLFTPRVGKNFGEVLGVECLLWVGAMRQTIESDTSGQIRSSDAIGGSESGSFQTRLQSWYDGLPPERQAPVSGIVGRLEAERDPVIRYDLDKAVAYPWNMLVGTELGLSDAWRMRAELGFIHRTQVILGVNYRFGGPSPGAPRVGEQ